jgi:hypothetical protein
MVMKNAAVSSGSTDEGSRSRQAVAPPPEDGRHVPFNDNEVVGSKVAAPYDHKGTIVVASIWLAVYVIMAIVISPTSQNQPAPLTAQARNGSVSTD